MLSGKGNEKGERTTMCLISKKATLHVQRTFLYIFLPLFCTTTISDFQKLPSYTFYGGNIVRFLAVPDTDLEITEWGQSSRPLEKVAGWGRSPKSSKNSFSALRASVWSKNKGEPGPPPAPPLDPSLSCSFFFFFTVAHFHPWWPRAYLIFPPPLQNFHVVLPTKNDSFVFDLSPTFSLSLSFSFPIFQIRGHDNQ